MKSIQQFLQEALIFSDKTIITDKEKFEDGTYKCLIVLGLCGSGKTTFGKYLATQYKCKYVQLDDVCNNFLINLYGDEDWSAKYGYTETVEKHREDFQREILKLLKRTKIKSIMEGTWPLQGSPILTEKFLPYPIVFMGTSLLRSQFQWQRREWTKWWNRTRSLKKAGRKIKEAPHMFNLMRNVDKVMQDMKKKKLAQGVTVEEYKVPKL